jgi:hypothetical protein
MSSLFPSSVPGKKKNPSGFFPNRSLIKRELRDSAYSWRNNAATGVCLNAEIVSPFAVKISMRKALFNIARRKPGGIRRYCGM